MIAMISLLFCHIERSQRSFRFLRFALRASVEMTEEEKLRYYIRFVQRRSRAALFEREIASKTNGRRRDRGRVLNRT